MQSLTPDWNSLVALAGAAALGALVCGLWMRAGMRRMRSAWQNADRELGRANAVSEQLRERLDDARDHLHAKSRTAQLVGTVATFKRSMCVYKPCTPKNGTFQRNAGVAGAGPRPDAPGFNRWLRASWMNRAHVFSQSQQSLDAMLRPFREQIDAFQKRVNAIHDEMRGTASLGTEIRRVAEMGSRISAEAGELASALRGDNKVLGTWGEVQLERTLELAGLIKGDHYVAQPPYRDAEHRRRYRILWCTCPTTNIWCWTARFRCWITSARCRRKAMMSARGNTGSRACRTPPH